MALESPPLAAAFRTLPRASETHNGDAGFVRIGGVSWLAVIDGLGHGEAAAAATSAALATLEKCTTDQASVEQVIEALNAGLAGTRGAGALVCRLSDKQLTGCSVGNVELRTTASGIGTVLSPGILGRRVAVLRVFEYTVPPRARMMMFSDGIRRTAELAGVRGLTPAQACEAIMSAHRDPGDDSTVLIADVGP